jgi:hypothetical protein
MQPTTLTPKDFYSFLITGKFPDYAAPKTSLLKRLLNPKNREQAIGPALRLTDNYSSKNTRPLLRQLYDTPNLLELPDDAPMFDTAYGSLLYSPYKLQQMIQAYRSEEPLVGDRYFFLRRLFFLYGYGPGYSDYNQVENLLRGFPEITHEELFCDLIFGSISGGHFSLSLVSFDSTVQATGNSLNDYFRSHENYFYNALLQASGVTHDASLAAPILALRQQATKEAIAQPVEKRKSGAEDMDFYGQLMNMPEEVRRSFLKVSLLASEHASLGKAMRTKGLRRLVSSIDWTSHKLQEVLDLYLNNKESVKLNRVLVSPLTEVLKITDDALYQKLKQVRNRYSHPTAAIEAVDEILRNYAKMASPVSGDITPIDLLRHTGFHPVPPTNTQQVYKGMRPDQVRPFFRLIRSITDSDIVKFYKDKDKQQFVRFNIKGNNYDLATANGLGVGITGPLNTLLFENSVPYQLVLVPLDAQTVLNDYNGYSFDMGKVKLTLVNKATYEANKHLISPSIIAGFAAGPAPAFSKSIEELDQAKERADLDKIDLQGDPKFSIIREELGKLTRMDAWQPLLSHALYAPADKKPGKIWTKKAKELVAALPPEEFQRGQAMILGKLMSSNEWFMDTEKQCCLRGLLCMGQYQLGSGQLYMLQQAVTKAYRKVPGGPLNAKLGNLALDVLASIGNLDAFGIMSNLEAKIAYPVAKRAIRSRQKKFTKLLKEYAPEDLAELAVSNYELKDNTKTITVGDCEAILKLEGLKTQIHWRTAAGKEQKSVPTHLKADHAAGIKAAKAEGKAIETTLGAQAKRLEKCWLSQRSWSLANWRSRYANHDLLKSLTNRLIWQLTTDERVVSGMLRDDVLCDASGIPLIGIDEANTRVQLWHPSLASVATVVGWQNYLFAKQTQQPFKQAFREVYLITPAEEATHDHSNRFANHQLRGNTFYSLGKSREWRMSYEEAPIFEVPGGKYLAELRINGRVLYSDCQTRELIFFRLEKGEKATRYGTYNRKKMPLAEVPAVVLSEVMRDVDLFVAVAGLGFEPELGLQGEGDTLTYWHRMSFGEGSRTVPSKMRAELLGRLLPMLKIKKQCTLEGNYLRVEGKLRTYKINLGSGNILMEPNDQYLCIVQGQTGTAAKRVWLPFEGGDHTLSLILSKAFLLAADDKIKDQQILGQIKRN